MKIVAVYSRKSKQTDKGESIETQINLCNDYIKRIFPSEEIKILLYNEGEGVSGGDSERKKFNELIRDAKNKKYNVLICYRLDRVARSVADFSDLIEELNDNNISFVSVKEQFDTSTPMGRLMLGILSAFAQLERENIRMRTRMGMKERVKSGLCMGGGRIPFGYDYNKEKGILVPNKDAEKVRQIYKLYIEGRSAQDIANMLGLKYDRLVYQILTRKSNF